MWNNHQSSSGGHARRVARDSGRKEACGSAGATTVQGFYRAHLFRAAAVVAGGVTASLRYPLQRGQQRAQENLTSSRELPRVVVPQVHVEKRATLFRFALADVTH